MDLLRSSLWEVTENYHNNNPGDGAEDHDKDEAESYYKSYISSTSMEARDKDINNYWDSKKMTMTKTPITLLD